MKKCKRCGIEKENHEFNKSSKSKDGLNSWCRDCKKSYSKEKYKNISRKEEGTKKCPNCNIEKDIIEFSKGGDKDGLGFWCRDCHNTYNKKNYEENKERLKPIRKNWKEKNEDKIKLYQRKDILK